MTIRPATVESYAFLVLVLSSAGALVAWIGGMLRPRTFGALPAALWLTLVAIALVCSGIVGILEFIR